MDAVGGELCYKVDYNTFFDPQAAPVKDTSFNPQALGYHDTRT